MEILAAFECLGEQIDAIVRQTDSWQLRARQLAEMLRSVWPSAPLYACLLEGNPRSGLFSRPGSDVGPANDDAAQLCVLDQSGKPRGEWAEWLRPGFASRPRLAGSKPANPAKLPEALKLPDYSLVSRAMISAGQSWGVLALAIPKGASPHVVAEARALLAVCGEQLALRFQSEAQERCLQALQEEWEAQSGLASTGELAGPLTHEFNNFLNIVLLHVALLETEVPENLRSEMIELRRQGAAMTALVKQFQQYRRRLQSIQMPVNLNRLVREAVEALAGQQADAEQGLVLQLPLSSRIQISGLGQPTSVPLNLALAAGLPPVLGSPTDLRRLCTFLLSNAAAAAGSVGGSVTLRTEGTDSQVLLRVEDTGPAIAADLLHQVFEPTTPGRPGTNSLELAACETLVRRLQGRIRCENRPDAGVVVTVELPTTKWGKESR